MAHLADFKYFDDSDLGWLIRIGRDNALAIGTNFEPIEESDGKLHYLPRNIEPRYVTTKHATKEIRREFYIQSIHSPIWKCEENRIVLPDKISGGMEVFMVKNRIEEKKLYTVRIK
jgi:hypothetical protein